MCLQSSVLHCLTINQKAGSLIGHAAYLTTNVTVLWMNQINIIFSFIHLGMFFLCMT